MFFCSSHEQIIIFFLWIIFSISHELSTRKNSIYLVPSPAKFIFPNSESNFIFNYNVLSSAHVSPVEFLPQARDKQILYNNHVLAT